MTFIKRRPNNNNRAKIFSQFIFPFSQWKRFFSLTNQQQVDCLVKHIENSQNLNLWSKQTEISNIVGNNKKQKRIQIVTPNSSPPATNRSHAETPSISKVRQQHQKSKQEWVVLPVFSDIVQLALKTREDCSTR